MGGWGGVEESGVCDCGGRGGEGRGSGRCKRGGEAGGGGVVRGGGGFGLGV